MCTQPSLPFQVQEGQNSDEKKIGFQNVLNEEKNGFLEIVYMFQLSGPETEKR